MKTVGVILKESRQNQGIPLERAAEGTKIRSEFLRALEEDNFSRLPSFACARGFIKNYAEFLNLPADSLLAVFKRDFPKSGGEAVTPGASSFWPKQGFFWTPMTTVIVAAALAVLLFLGYLFWQFSFLAKTPYR